MVVTRPQRPRLPPWSGRRLSRRRHARHEIRSGSVVKVAVPIWDSRVSPVFDVAREVLVAEIERAGVGRRAVRPLGETTASSRSQSMIDLGVEVLICGAISHEPARFLRARGVRIIPNRCGDVDAVLGAYIAGEIDDRRYAMPGGPRRDEPARPKPSGHAAGIE
jgi:predicted Fe-Mo cluster-binding NifX family protein